MVRFYFKDGNVIKYVHKSKDALGYISDVEATPLKTSENFPIPLPFNLLYFRGDRPLVLLYKIIQY